MTKGKAMFFKSKRKKQIEEELWQFKRLLEELPPGARIQLGTIYNDKYYEYDSTGKVIPKERE